MMRGFTLLELLVATAVFIGLALILVSIAASLSSFWQLGIAHNERRSSALSAFSRMARDLRFASLPPDPSAANFQLVINPAERGGQLFASASCVLAGARGERPLPREHGVGGILRAMGK